MERTLMPMGVASISLIRVIPGASADRTWPGSGRPAVAASRPGIRLSKIRVVLPEPETPVTAVSFPLGMSTSSGFTVWMAPVDRWMRPRSNRPPDPPFLRGLARPERKGPIRDSGRSATSATVPWAMTLPPSVPAPGPISMIQSAWESIWVS